MGRVTGAGATQPIPDATVSRTTGLGSRSAPTNAAATDACSARARRVGHAWLKLRTARGGRGARFDETEGQGFVEPRFPSERLARVVPGVGVRDVRRSQPAKSRATAGRSEERDMVSAGQRLRGKAPGAVRR